MERLSSVLNIGNFRHNFMAWKCSAAREKLKSFNPGPRLDIRISLVPFSSGVGQVGGCDQAGVKAPGVLMPSAAPAARRALRHCEQIQAIENAPTPFKVKVHGKLPVCLEAGALTMVPVTCPQLESAEFLLEPLSFDGEQLPEVAEGIDMEDTAEMPEETTVAQCLEVWVAAQVVVECSPTVTLSVRVTSQGLRSAIPMGEGTRRYRQSECRLLFS
ncbi:unnamed protein product [Boreogadus saida]